MDNFEFKKDLFKSTADVREIEYNFEKIEERAATNAQLSTKADLGSDGKVKPEQLPAIPDVDVTQLKPRPLTGDVHTWLDGAALGMYFATLHGQANCPTGNLGHSFNYVGLVHAPTYVTILAYLVDEPNRAWITSKVANAWPGWSELAHKGDIAGLVPRTVILQHSADLNTLVESGFYRLAEGHANSPTQMDTNYGQLIVSRGQDTIAQIALPYTSNRMAIRSGTPPEVGGSGTWSPWRELAGKDDVAGLLPLVHDVGNVRMIRDVVSRWSRDGFATGAIKITMPNGFNDLMVGMTIKAFEYGRGFTLDVGGYLYAWYPAAPGSWYNPYAQCFGRNMTNGKVRFGIDANEKCCILIGDTDTTWSHLGIIVTEVFDGYVPANLARDGWTIEYVTSTDGITFSGGTFDANVAPFVPRKTQNATTTINLLDSTLANGNIFKLTPDFNVTLTATDTWIPPDVIKEFELHITMGGTVRSITWWGGITWLNGVPVFSANKTGVVTFRLSPGGAFVGNLAYEY